MSIICIGDFGTGTEMQYKVSKLKYLLENYCSITSEIYNAFIFLDDLGLDEHISSTKDDIENKRIVVINYPFLS